MTSDAPKPLTFKGVSGHYLTSALFFEQAASPEEAVFTLKDEDHEYNGKVYKSLRKLYVQTEDPTEYLFATTVLGGWGHWEKLKETAWFRPYLQSYREELTISIKAKALAAIRSEAVNQGKSAFAANKLLLEGGWDKEKGGVGRTTKEKIKKEAEALFSKDTDVHEDYKRMGLN